MKPNLCSAELDRLTAAEVAIDEAMTILERHGRPVPDELQRMSKLMDASLLAFEGAVSREARLTRVRDVLTLVFPLEDADLTSGH